MDVVIIAEVQHCPSKCMSFKLSFLRLKVFIRLLKIYMINTSYFAPSSVGKGGEVQEKRLNNREVSRSKASDKKLLIIFIVELCNEGVRKSRKIA